MSFLPSSPRLALLKKIALEISKRQDMVSHKYAAALGTKTLNWMNDKAHVLGPTGLHHFFSALWFKEAFDRCTSVWVCTSPHCVCVCCWCVCVLFFCVWEWVCAVSWYFCVAWKRSEIWFMCQGMSVLFCFQCFRVSLQIAIPIVWCDTLEERNNDFPLPQF